MAKEVTNSCHSPSRAVVLARERAKRRQGRMWVGLMSAEKMMVRSAETFRSVEGKTARSARVRTVRAPRCQRTHARMYDRCRDLGGLCATTARSVAVAKVKGKSERRMHGAEKSDSAIVVMNPVNKAWGATWRSWRSEGPGATGDAKGGPCSEHRVGKPQDGLYAGRERSGTEGPQGLPSQPERGAVCLSGHARICAGPVG